MIIPDSSFEKLYKIVKAQEQNIPLTSEQIELLSWLKSKGIDNEDLRRILLLGSENVKSILMSEKSYQEKRKKVIEVFSQDPDQEKYRKEWEALLWVFDPYKDLNDLPLNINFNLPEYDDFAFNSMGPEHKRHQDEVRKIFNEDLERLKKEVLNIIKTKFPILERVEKLFEFMEKIKKGKYTFAELNKQQETIIASKIATQVANKYGISSKDIRINESARKEYLSKIEKERLMGELKQEEIGNEEFLFQQFDDLIIDMLHELLFGFFNCEMMEKYPDSKIIFSGDSLGQIDRKDIRRLKIKDGGDRYIYQIGDLEGEIFSDFLELRETKITGTVDIESLGRRIIDRYEDYSSPIEIIILPLLAQELVGFFGLIESRVKRLGQTIEEAISDIEFPLEEFLLYKLKIDNYYTYNKHSNSPIHTDRRVQNILFWRLLLDGDLSDAVKAKKEIRYKKWLEEFREIDDGNAESSNLPENIEEEDEYKLSDSFDDVGNNSESSIEKRKQRTFGNLRVKKGKTHPSFIGTYKQQLMAPGSNIKISKSFRKKVDADYDLDISQRFILGDNWLPLPFLKDTKIVDLNLKSEGQTLKEGLDFEVFFDAISKVYWIRKIRRPNLILMASARTRPSFRRKKEGNISCDLSISYGGENKVFESCEVKLNQNKLKLLIEELKLVGFKEIANNLERYSPNTVEQFIQILRNTTEYVFDGTMCKFDTGYNFEELKIFIKEGRAKWQCDAAGVFLMLCLKKLFDNNAVYMLNGYSIGLENIKNEDSSVANLTQADLHRVVEFVDPDTGRVYYLDSTPSRRDKLQMNELAQYMEEILKDSNKDAVSHTENGEVNKEVEISKSPTEEIKDQEVLQKDEDTSKKKTFHSESTEEHEAMPGTLARKKEIIENRQDFTEFINLRVISFEELEEDLVKLLSPIFLMKTGELLQDRKQFYNKIGKRKSWDIGFRLASIVQKLKHTTKDVGPEIEKLKRDLEIIIKTELLKVPKEYFNYKGFAPRILAYLKRVEEYYYDNY